MSEKVKVRFVGGQLDGRVIEHNPFHIGNTMLDPYEDEDYKQYRDVYTNTGRKTDAGERVFEYTRREYE
jgi:hypothetical protein